MHTVLKPLLLYQLLAMVLLAGCAATTDVTAVWKDPAYQGRPQKILLYAILKNSKNRRIVEDEFAGQFKRSGVNAVPGYEVLPGEDLVTVEVLQEKLKSQGFDALLLTRITGTGEQVVNVPATATSYPVPSTPGVPTYSGYPGYYNVGYRTTYSPAYTFEEHYVMTETRLFDVASEKLIWSASAETRFREADVQLVKEYVNKMMSNLRRDKVVP